MSEKRNEAELAALRKQLRDAREIIGKLCVLARELAAYTACQSPKGQAKLVAKTRAAMAVGADWLARQDAQDAPK